MVKIKEKDFKYLSFPDSVVEEMNFSPVHKTIKLYVDSAWLDLNSGIKLKKGVLIFKDWISLSIKRYNSKQGKWLILDEIKAETLIDLADFRIDENNVTLAGFGKELGQWLEWNIVGAKIHAEFEN